MKKKVKEVFKFVVATVALIGLTKESLASSTSTSVNRVAKPLSVTVGLNSPSPSLLGINVGYAYNDSLRFTLGHGNLEATTSLAFTEGGIETKKSTVDTYGIGAEYTMPGWNFAPTAGLKVAYVSYGGEKGIKVGGFEKSGTNAYTNLGFDWQTASGFKMAAGYNLSFTNSDASSAYFNIGWAYGI